MNCKKCGNDLREKDMFCSRCGSPVNYASHSEEQEDKQNITKHDTFYDTVNEASQQTEYSYAIKKKKTISKRFIVIISAVIVSIIIGIIYVNSTEPEPYTPTYSTNNDNDNNYYLDGLDKSMGLLLEVNKIEKKSSYTYVYCTVKNVSSNYGMETRYRYVKVKAQFKNYAGTIVDTDWTYAVDSTWLEPGESKTFYYMVKNTSVSSATLSFAE